MSNTPTPHTSTWRETAEAGVGVSVAADLVVLTIQTARGTERAYINQATAYALAADLQAAGRAAANIEERTA